MKLSIIVPVYNTGKYLSNTLNSLVNTSITDKEIICINDGSTDDSLDILELYKKLYREIKVINLKENSGCSYARNIGLSCASGNYIAFCDSDDLVSINMYQDYIKYMEYYNIKIATGLHSRIEDNDLDNTLFTSNNIKPIISDMNIDYNFWGQTEAVWDKVYDHSLIQGIKFLENCNYEDISFSYPTLLMCDNILVFNRSDYKYRNRLGSIMNSTVFMRDLFSSCMYAIDIAYKYNLSQEKINILEDKLKEKIYEKIVKLDKKEQLDMLKMASHIIPSFNTSNTEYAKPFLEYYHDELTRKKTIN